MKVCLVFPPPEKGMTGPWLNPYLPYGFFSLAAYLEKQGHEVMAIDCMIEEMSHAQLKEKVSAYRPDMFGVTLLSSVHRSGHKCLQLAREIDKNMLTVLGGAHASALDRELLQNWPEADIVVRKEGEIALSNLLAQKERLSVIKGITYREGREIIRNQDEKTIDDLDSLPFPALHLAKLDKYFRLADRYEFHLRSPSSSIMASRGCIGKCTYCASPFLWPKLRINSPEYVVENIKFQQQGYGIKDFKFFDDYFPVSKGWMKRFHQRIKEQKIDISYRCMGRADLVDDETLEMMRETGCYYIDFGIESGSPRILEGVNKKLNMDQVRNAIGLTKKHKINCGAFFMIGFPGETIRDLLATKEMSLSLPFDRVCFSRTRIYPGTKMYEDGRSDSSFWFKDSNRGDIYNAPMYRPDGYSDDDLDALMKYFTYEARKKHFWRNLSLFYKMRKKRLKIFIFLAALKQLFSDAFNVDRTKLQKLAIK